MQRQRLVDRWFTWLLRHRVAVLAVNIIIIAGAGAAASRVPIDFTLEQFFPNWGAERELYDRYKRSFPKEDMQVSVFWKDSRPLGLAIYRDLARAAELFDEVGLQDVRWFGNIELPEAAADGMRVRPLIEADSLSDAYIRRELGRHRDDAGYTGWLWNANQSTFAIHSALTQRDMADDARRREVEERLQRGLEELAGERAEFVVSGVPVTRSRVPKMLDEDQRMFVGAGVLIFLAALFLFFRHAGQAVLCLASVLPAFLGTVTLIGLAGKPVTILTGFIPIIVLVVGGSDIVHLLSRYRQLRREGRDNDRAVASAFSELATPCFYTSLTTAIGFLSLMGTRIGIVMDFGLFTSLAIFLTYAYSMTLLPVLLGFYGRKSFAGRGLRVRWIDAFVEAAAALAARPSRKVVASFVAVALVALGLAATQRVDTYLIDDLKPGAGVRRDLIWLEDNGFGIYQVVVFMRQDGQRPLHDPESLRWMAAFQDFVARQPPVVTSFALPDMLGPLRGAVLDGDAGLPQTLEESSQLIFLGQLHDARIFSDLYREADGEAQIVVAVRDAGSQVMLPFLTRVDRYLEENPPPVGSAVSTGTVKLIQSYSARVLQNFAPSLAVAIVLIFGVMSFMLRSPRFGLLALIPNLFPLLMVLAVMKVAGFALKPSTILVCSIAFGLAVDDSLHLLGRFRRGLRRGLVRQDAMVSAVREAGPAMVMTTVVVWAGFSPLLASRFEVLFLVGLMTMVSAVTALAADLFVFPAIVASSRVASVKGSAAPKRRKEVDRDEMVERDEMVDAGPAQRPTVLAAGSGSNGARSAVGTSAGAGSGEARPGHRP